MSVALKEEQQYTVEEKLVFILDELWVLEDWGGALELRQDPDDECAKHNEVNH